MAYSSATLDNGPSTGNGTLQVGQNSVAPVYIETHLPTLTTAASSGVPGGLTSNPSSAGTLGPTEHAYQDVQAYGTVSNGGAVVPQFNLGGTSAFGPVNPSGAGNLLLFRFKNPG